MAGTLLSISKLHLSRPSTSPSSSAYRRPSVIVSVVQNQCYWDSIHSDIETHLKKTITIRHPISVFEPMHQLTFSHARTTAAALCIAACELVGGNREDALVAASAIHMMHSAAYAHEHLPLSDQVGFGAKHGPKPETPHAFGPNIQLLTGDGILPFGFELLTRSVDPARNNTNKILRVIIEISRAVSAERMIDWSKDQPLHGLCECGATCGAILGGGNEIEIEKLKKYGFYVGMIDVLLYGVTKNEGCKMELVDKWRGLALKELEYFDGKKIEQISSIVCLNN